MKKLIIKLLPKIMLKFYSKRIKKKNPDKFSGKSLKEAFTQIYESNHWQAEESVSGTGSDNIQTKEIIKELPKLIKKYRIQSMIDVPCGDFNWMSKVNLSEINYLGADIVEELIAINTKNYSKGNISFVTLDLTKDKLPQADLIFVRDCFVHLSYENIYRALTNICNSESKYLLTTSFHDRKTNFDIPLGKWRPINLVVPPFNFPAPLDMIIENCTEGNGVFSDKALMMWEIKSLKHRILKE